MPVGRPPAHPYTFTMSPLSPSHLPLSLLAMSLAGCATYRISIPAYPGETPPHQPHMHVAQRFAGHGMNRRTFQTPLLCAQAGGDQQN